MCRKSHGAAFGTYARATGGVHWLSGRADVEAYESSPGFQRPFCSRCGSVVAGEPQADGSAFLPVGCLDEDPGARPLAHIFVASRAPWHEITDALPRFDAYPPGMGGEIVRSAPLQPASGRASGSCLCGRVVYEIPTGDHAIVCCHCGRCRKARSTAHATNLFLPAAELRWVRGEDEILSYKIPEAARFTNAFCRTCGAILPRVDAGRGLAVVPAGTLDQDPGARERFHIFTAYKAPWYEIRGDLPQHPEAAT